MRTLNEVHALICDTLKQCGFSHSQEDINNLIEWALEHMVDSYQEIHFLENSDWISTIGIMAPKVILPTEHYAMVGLKTDVIEMVCRALKRKKINATRREVHELVFEAEQLEENYEKINDMRHAVNYVVKIFENGGWQTPEGFDDKFDFYRHKVKPLIPTKNIIHTLH